MSRWNQFTYNAMREVLFDAKPVRYMNPVDLDDALVARKHRIQTIVPGRAEGHLIGGNLTPMRALVGTPHLTQFDNAILFLAGVR